MIYADIKTAALVYADRVDDLELTSDRLDSFLRIVEARINRQLNTQPMNETYTTIGVAGQLIYALPENWLIIRNVIRRVSDAVSGVSLASINLEQLNNARANNSSNAYYSIRGNEMHVHPTLLSTDVLEVAYTTRLVPLSATAPENAVAKFNPDCYIFGLLVEISSFVKDAAATAAWDSRFKEALSEISYQDMSATWAGIPLQIRVG